MQQEVNLYYVALTRAKDKVIDRTDNNVEYSAFIDDLKEKQKQNNIIQQNRYQIRKRR